MATKNLGHYEGEVEDIDIDSLKFKMLSPLHQEVIKLSREKESLSNQIKAIDERITSIRDQLLPQAKILNWLWIWYKKSTRVKWKEEFVKALGQPKANEVTKQYATTEYPQLGIKYVDPLPESIVQVKDNPSKFPIIKHKLK